MPRFGEKRTIEEIGDEKSRDTVATDQTYLHPVSSYSLDNEKTRRWSMFAEEKFIDEQHIGTGDRSVLVASFSRQICRGNSSSIVKTQ